MFIIISPARTASRAKRSAADSVPADFNPGACPILALHWFDVELPRPVGSIAAEVVADLQFRRKVIES